MGEEGVDLNGEAEKFEAALADTLRPVHIAVGEALARLAEQGITARTDFNAREGLLIVWLEGPEPEAGES